MCGIAGALSLKQNPIKDLNHSLALMSDLIKHRGPDGQGVWTNKQATVGLAHRRLAVIDLTQAATQPMRSNCGLCITFNGEIYNFQEIRSELRKNWNFTSLSDTETILAAYSKFHEQCLSRLRGMFSLAIWDPQQNQLFCARDRFGIKPFYYTLSEGVFYFASEAKALLPFLEKIETDESAFSEYLTFQYTIGEKTLFKGIKQLLPGHSLTVKNGTITINRYWDVDYKIDFEKSEASFHEELDFLMTDSMRMHLRSDVEIGSYLSGGIDSSLMFSLSNRLGNTTQAYHGRFTDYPGYDESPFAQDATDHIKGILHTVDISAEDFSENLEKIIYHLDFPVAGPGSFPQFMTSALASKDVKVVLGGQGGDEIFGGYARYVIAYFEQCIKAAIDGQYKNGNYVVTLESIVPNLGLLQEYKPLIQKFWSEGLFQPMDERYFRLIDRSTDLQKEIIWEALNKKQVFSDYRSIFNNKANVRKEAYFDKMTHFDFKCLIPALLQVEDRMSMAHGLESRVPLLDHPLIEFAATVPADVKFKDGQMKHLIKKVFSKDLPSSIIDRRDKMGFPVPLKEWFDNDLKDFSTEILRSMAKNDRPFINSEQLNQNQMKEAKFSRKTWALLSLEIWYQQFHDRSSYWKGLRSRHSLIG